MPYTHLRTFKAGLLDDVDDSNFQDENKKWYRAGGDGSIFYTLIEKADPAKIKVVTDIVYSYNDINPLNDYKIKYCIFISLLLKMELVSSLIYTYFQYYMYFIEI